MSSVLRERRDTPGDHHNSRLGNEHQWLLSILTFQFLSPNRDCRPHKNFYKELLKKKNKKDKTFKIQSTTYEINFAVITHGPNICHGTARPFRSQHGEKAVKFRKMSTVPRVRKPGF